jgi:hypothetical protein
MKKLTQKTLIGDQGIALIHTIVSGMGFAWNPTSLDAGIDGFIELREPETERATNCIIQVQSKATEGTWEAETAGSFQFRCDQRDIEYWLGGNAPVVLVCSRPKTQEAYWVSVKEYFTDLASKKACKVVFDKAKDRFDTSSRPGLEKLAIRSDSGLYLGTRPKPELIYSNLLKVSSLPEHYFVAQTDFRTKGEVFAALRELTDKYKIRGEWVLNNKTIFCLHDLSSHPWKHICDAGTIEQMDTADWSETSDDGQQRLFVQLLNACLREKLYRKGVSYSREQDYFFFRATPELTDLDYSYQSRENRTVRSVFKGYRKKLDPSQMSYYRHSAFRGRFIRFGGEWLLQITPTYHYTRDGWLLSRFAGPLTSGMKRLENNQAVHGQVVMWAALLAEQQSLFESVPIIQFTSLEEFTLDVGLSDDAWLKREAVDKRKALEAAPEGEQTRLI